MVGVKTVVGIQQPEDRKSFRALRGLLKKQRKQEEKADVEVPEALAEDAAAASVVEQERTETHEIGQEGLADAAVAEAAEQDDSTTQESLTTSAAAEE